MDFIIYIKTVWNNKFILFKIYLSSFMLCLVMGIY